jgi:hypothetical protein
VSIEGTGPTNRCVRPLMRPTSLHFVALLGALSVSSCGAPPARLASNPDPPSRPVAPTAADPLPAPPSLALPALAPRTLAVGSGFSCASRGSDVLCWGWDTSGSRVDAVGEAAMRGRPRTPRVVPGLGPSEELVAADHEVCARHPDGSVWCSREPQRGNAAVEVEALRGASRIATGPFLRCGLFSEGPRCVDPRSRPFAADPVPDAMDLFSAGSEVCVTRRDHDAVCWVGRGAGQVDVRTLPSTAGAPFVGYHMCVGTGATARCPGMGYIDVVPLHSVAEAGELRWLGASGYPGVVWALRADGTVWRRSETGPWEATGLTEASELALTPQHACARSADGTVRCLGENADGRADGVGPSPEGPPTRVLGVERAVDVASSDEGACALSEDGALSCWTRRSDSAQPVSLAAPLVEIGATRAGVCGRDALGGVSCVALARDTGVGPARPLPGLDARGGLIVDVGHRHVCGVAEGGAVHCRGEDGGERADAASFASLDGADDLAWTDFALCGRLPHGVLCVAPFDSDARERWLVRGAVERFYGGAYQAFLVRRGRLEAMGSNETGELGLRPPPGHARACPGEGCPSDVSRVARPRRVSGWPSPVGMAFGPNASCAWAETGPIHCAGYRGDLSLPYGYEEPFDGDIRPIPEVTEVRAASLAPTSCAVDGRGAVWCWGVGHRGDGHPAYLSEPRTVSLPEG